VNKKLTAKIFAVKMTLWAELGELNIKARCTLFSPEAMSRMTFSMETQIAYCF
jgi:hypothetical protein